MAKCRRLHQVEAFFDGEMAFAPPDVAEHAASCPVCSRYLAQLRTLRAGAADVATHETITDGQFPSFFEGIRERLDDAPARVWRRFWALASMSAAAILIALALYVLFADFSAPSRRVEATVVESTYSELDGVSIDVQIGQDGDAVIWVNNAPDDVWYGNP
ncbi:MAG: hypothetical protein KA184_16985 [Candidatus Hydrogenedentes bacterium]|nr:hypothetical protein [Candidatus Hydrogenedentota bacterium]